jgi:hypothetical protein
VTVDQAGVPQAFAQTRAEVNNLGAGLVQAGQQGAEAGAQIKGGMDKAAYSITEARLAARGLGQELGVSVNREVSRFLATSSTIGPLLAKAFSVIAVVGLVEIIFKLVEVINKAASAMAGFGEVAQKAYQQAVDANLKQIVTNNELTNQLVKINTIGLEGNEKQQAAMRGLVTEGRNNAATLRVLVDMESRLTAETEGVSAATKVWYETLGKTSAAGIIYNQAAEQLPKVRAEIDALTKSTRELDVVTKQRAAAEASAEATKLSRERQAARIEGDKTVGEATIKQAEQIAKGEHEVHMMSDEDYTAFLVTEENKRYENSSAAMEKSLALARSEGSVKGAEVIKLTKEIEALYTSHNTKLREINDEADKVRYEKLLSTVEKTRSLETDVVNDELEGIRKASSAREAGIKARSPLGEADPRIVKEAKAALQEELTVIENLTAAENARGEELKALHVEEDDPAMQAHLKAQVELTKMLQKAWEDYGQTVARVQNAAVADVDKFISRTEGELNRGIVSWMNRQQTFGRAMQQVWMSIADTAVESLLKVGEQMLANLITKEAIDSGTRLSDARTAAANTWSSVSGIPLIGPFIAPAAAAAAFAAVLAFEQGGIVPSTQMALVHKNEMVLPANISQSLQRGGGAGDVILNYNPSVSGIDTSGIKDMLDQHGDMFAAMIHRHLRRGNR